MRRRRGPFTGGYYGMAMADNYVDSTHLHLDQVTIYAVTIDYPWSGNPPLEEYEFVFNPAGAFDMDWLTSELDTANHQPPNTDGQRMLARPFILEQKRRHTSWGADASTAAYVLQVASEAAGVLVLEEVLGRLASQLSSKVRNIRWGKITTNMLDTQIETFGKDLIEMHYGVPNGTLSSYSVEADYQACNFTYAGDNGNGEIFTVVFSVRGGEANLMRRSRTATR